MKRDMELIRKILLAIEEQYEDVALDDLEIEGYSFKTVAYHCKILYDAGLISDYGGSYGDGELIYFGVGSLTWEGHEFLDAARDDKRWKNAMSTVKEKGGSITLDILKQLLIQLMKNTFLG